MTSTVSWKHVCILLWRPGATLFISIVFAALLTRYSVRAGVLSAYPKYDDISYLADGLTWLDHFRAGWAATAAAYVRNPPHAPVHTFAGAVAFAVFGVHRWAAYLFNAMVVWLLLELARAMLDGVGVAGHLATLGLILFTPMTWSAVFYFRPDILAGLAVAGGSLIVCQRAGGGMTARRRVIAGLLLGAALIVKPSVFPLTLLMAGSVMILAAWEGRTGKSLLPIAAPMMLAGLLYYPFAWRQISQYTWTNSVGEHGLPWKPIGDWRAYAAYYLTGPGNTLMLGDELFPLLLMCVAAGMVVLCRKPRPEGAWARLLFAGLLAGEAYLVSAENPTKNAFLGAAFHAMVLLGAVAAAGMLWRTAAVHRRAKILTPALAVLVAGIGMAFGQRPVAETVGAARQAAREDRTIDGVWAVLAGEKTSAPLGRVFITAPGVVNADVLVFLAHRDGIGLQFSSTEFEVDLDFYRRRFDESDWVIASEGGNPDLFRYKPPGGMQEQVLRLIRSRADFSELARLEPGYVVFRRRRD